MVLLKLYIYIYLSIFFCDFFLFFPLLARLVFVAGDLEKSFALLTVMSGILKKVLTLPSWAGVSVILYPVQSLLSSILLLFHSVFFSPSP